MRVLHHPEGVAGSHLGVVDLLLIVGALVAIAGVGYLVFRYLKRRAT